MKIANNKLTKTRINIIGAFDRFNYGDILFSHISEYMFKNEYSNVIFDHYSLRRSDLTMLGGVKTKPLSQIYKLKKIDNQKEILLISGGEVLSPSWGQMYEHHCPRRLALILKKIHRRMKKDALRDVYRYFYKCPNLQPWTIDPEDLDQNIDLRVIYNTVGGTSAEGLSPETQLWQEAALKRADWVAVRDKKTAKQLAKRNVISVYDAPDSAVMLKKIIESKKPKFVETYTTNWPTLESKKYICFQCAERWARNDIDKISEELRKIHIKTGLDIYSFSIGTAAGHDDQETVRRLNEKLKHESWHVGVVTQPSIGEVLETIRNSQAYIGTSLHGYLTAFSFGIPRVGLLRAIDKRDEFAEDWDLKRMSRGVPFNDMAAGLDRSLETTDTERKIVALRAEEAYEAYFVKLIKKINKETNYGG